MNKLQSHRTRPCSVSELNSYIAKLVGNDETLHYILVEGEISGIKIYSSGHAYFTLKDENSTINCVMFGNYLKNARIKPHDGMQVWMAGEVSVYQKQGRYQFYVEKIQPAGLGNYYLKLEELKKKLAAEGLFDEKRKKLLPLRPTRIGIVSSLQGAGLRDMVRILRLKQPGIEIIIASTLVQGIEAPPMIALAIEKLNHYNSVDVIIVGRGGGSAEDLAAFNDEQVVRAVAMSEIPTISAVGHEVDFTLCDYAADVRAATPTQAADLAVPDDKELISRLEEYARVLRNGIKRILRNNREELMNVQERLIKSSRLVIIEKKRITLNQLEIDFKKSMLKYINECNNRLEKKIIQMESLNPVKVLKRGYSVVEKGGKILTSAHDAQVGDKLRITCWDGTVETIVIETKDDLLFDNNDNFR